MVVTNAHVVAGQDDTTVQLGGEGPSLDAQAVWYDPQNDLAILRVPGIGGAPAAGLNVDAKPGTSAAVLGFPENGPYDVRPARLGQTAAVITQDAYGRGPVQRTITSLRGLVRHGQLGWTGGGRRPAGWWPPCSPPAARRRPRRLRGAGLDRARARSAGARGAVDTGPCAQLERRYRARSRGPSERAAISSSAWPRSLARLPSTGVVEVVARKRQLHLEAPVAVSGEDSPQLVVRPRPTPRRRPRRGSACAQLDEAPVLDLVEVALVGPLARAERDEHDLLRRDGVQRLGEGAHRRVGGEHAAVHERALARLDRLEVGGRGGGGARDDGQREVVVRRGLRVRAS